MGRTMDEAESTIRGWPFLWTALAAVSSVIDAETARDEIEKAIWEGRLFVVIQAGSRYDSKTGRPKSRDITSDEFKRGFTLTLDGSLDLKHSIYPATLTQSPPPPGSPYFDRRISVRSINRSSTHLITAHVEDVRIRVLCERLAATRGEPVAVVGGPAAPSKPAHPAECKHSDGLSDQTYAMYRRMIEKELPKHPGISLEHIAAESDSSALRTFLRLKDRKGLPRMLQRVLARLRVELGISKRDENDEIDESAAT